MPFDFASHCWFLTGATASGKSSVGIELARKLDAEIVSLDSMAIYRGMDIGTAKPTPEQRQIVPHHLVDIVDPHEEFSLAQYIEAAERCVTEICGRGRHVLFIGGTPLYLKGLLRGIFDGPPADWAYRHTLADKSQQHGDGWLHQRLAEVDPTAAAKLHPNDTRRLIRALEVHEKTGQPISALQAQFEIGRSPEECRVFVLDWPRAELHERIHRRVEEMFAAGLVDEVRGLLAADRPMSKTARQAVGYREVIEHLDGHCGLAEAVELVDRHTRQLAKRQNTWFRSLSECRFFVMHQGLSPADVANAVLRMSATIAKLP